MSIMKQLIESMIGDYLNESYEDDLVESIFEEVSEETWDAIEEAILNELSPELLDRYKKKAFKSRDRADAQSYRAAKPETREKNKEKAQKRNKGIGSAIKRDMAKDQASGRGMYMGGFGSKPDYKRNSLTAKSPEDMIKADIGNLSADEFQKKYRTTKAEWERKNK